MLPSLTLTGLWRVLKIQTERVGKYPANMQCFNSTKEDSLSIQTELQDSKQALNLRDEDISEASWIELVDDTLSDIKMASCGACSCVCGCCYVGEER